MVTVTSRPVRRSRLQRGLSLVEMMVGVAVGLVVVAAAATLVSTQLLENRRLLIETQLQQDLRATADIMSRELRRAGVQAYSVALQTLWYPGATGVLSNNFAEHLATGTGEVTFEYRPANSTDELFGFKLDTHTNVIKSKIGGVWQELTDANVVKVTALTITPRSSTPTVLPCPKLCSDGTADCWPRLQVRDIDIAIAAESKAMPEVKRTLFSTVRLRNDHVRFFDAAANQICPS